MSREVFIADSAAVCALGDSLDESWPRIHAGQTAIRPAERIPTDDLYAHNAACIEALAPIEDENRVLALMRRALGQITPPPAETPILWCGVKAGVEWIEALSTGAEPAPYWLPCDYHDWLCQELGAIGHGTEINAACASSAVGLATGAQMIAGGEAQIVLVCAADAVTHFTFTGFASLRALSQSICRPFDTERDGLSLGDGAVAMILASREGAKRMKLKPKARLAGWGVANDANHITGPARDGCGLVDAIQSALRQAGLAPDAIGAFCAHGTGTVYNDAMELTALETVFGERRFPLFSIKGAIGHTLGAAGGIEAALCVRALSEGLAPATAGLENIEPRAQGRASGQSQEMDAKAILSTNSGFGGVNAALIFEAI